MVMMLADVQQEIKEAEDWKAGRYDLSMKKEDFDFLCNNGFGRCGEICMSAKYVGEDACMCVRSLFPSQSHYYHYVEVISERANKTAEKLAYSVLSEEGEN